MCFVPKIDFLPFALSLSKEAPRLTRDKPVQGRGAEGLTTKDIWHIFFQPFAGEQPTMWV